MPWPVADLRQGSGPRELRMTCSDGNTPSVQWASTASPAQLTLGHPTMKPWVCGPGGASGTVMLISVDDAYLSTVRQALKCCCSVGGLRLWGAMCSLGYNMLVRNSGEVCYNEKNTGAGIPQCRHLCSLLQGRRRHLPHTFVSLVTEA